MKEEESKTEDSMEAAKISVKVKISGINKKPYGEYTFKGVTEEEARKMGEGAYKLLVEHLEKLKKLLTK